MGDDDVWLGNLINRVIPQKSRKALSEARAINDAKRFKLASNTSPSSSSSSLIDVDIDNEKNYPRSSAFDLFGGAISVDGASNVSTTYNTNSRSISIRSSGNGNASANGSAWTHVPAATPTNRALPIPLTLSAQSNGRAGAASANPSRQAQSQKQGPGQGTIDKMFESCPSRLSTGASASASASVPPKDATVTASSNWKAESSLSGASSSSSVNTNTSAFSISSVQLSAEDFSGASQLNIRNIATTIAGLDRFLHTTTRAEVVGISVIWNDLTSNHTSLFAHKFCKPAENCNVWYCACGRHTRADRAFQPLLGVCFVLCPPHSFQSNDTASCSASTNVNVNADADMNEEVLYFLPLSPCRSDLTTPMTVPGTGTSPTYVLPLICQVPLQARWAALLRILGSTYLQKVMYHAQLGLLPLIHGLETNPISSYSPEMHYFCDPKVAAFLVSERESIEGEEAQLELPALLQQCDIHLPTCPPSFSVGRATYMMWATHQELRGILAVQRVMSKQLREVGMSASFVRTEMPLVRLLALMEYRGVSMDTHELTSLLHEIETQIRQVCDAAHQCAGQQFNLASPEQAAHVLYDVCGVRTPPGSKDKQKAALCSGAGNITGKHATTSSEWLKEVEKEHPIVPLLLNFRGLGKLRSTYDWRNFLYLPTCVTARSNCTTNTTNVATKGGGGQGRIHSRWNQQTTRTGRLSSSQPNQQQVPKDRELGSLGVSSTSIDIRKLFKAPTRDYVLISADYAQIEMRVMAHVCGDANMIRLFQTGVTEVCTETAIETASTDIYLLMAASVFSKSPSSVTPKERAKVKQVALGIIYGMGPDAVAKKLDIPLNEAKKTISDFYRRFPGIGEWMTRAKEQARRQGYVTSLLKFRRYLPDIQSSDNASRAKAERSAINSIIQGSAADILKVAMLCVDAAITATWSHAQVQTQGQGQGQGQLPLPRVPQLIMSIHDEVIYEVHRSDVQEFVGLLKRVMEVRYVMSVAIAIAIAHCPMILFDVGRSYTNDDLD